MKNFDALEKIIKENDIDESSNANIDESVLCPNENQQWVLIKAYITLGNANVQSTPTFRKNDNITLIWFTFANGDVGASFFF